MNPNLNHAGLTSTWHLAETPLEAAVTEFEWAMLRWAEAFERYQLEMLNRLGQSSLSTQEVQLLHAIRMKDRPKATSMIASLLNRDDIQNIQYSLRKLVAQKLVKKMKDGVGKSYNLSVTEKGRRMTDDLASIRRKLLVEQVETVENGEARLHETARMVTLMAGICNEGARTFAPREALSAAPEA